MSDAATKEQVEATAPIVEVPAPQDTSVPGTEDVKMEEIPAAAVEAPVIVKCEENPAALTGSVEAPQEVQNGDVKPEKTDKQLPPTEVKKNRKFDPSTLPETDDPALIRNQVEFYFGDSNLPIDKFMWESTGGEENKPVLLKTLCDFKRMRRFQPYTAVVAALKASNFLEVEGEEGEEVVKRKKPYVSVPDIQKKKVAQSVYIKGFGEEGPSTQFDIEAWLSNYGTVNLVKLRRTPNDDTFKGSIFVEFHTEELAKSFVALDPAPTWKGNELKIMMKRDYLNEKTRMIQAGEMEPSKFHRTSFFEGKERGGKDRARGTRGAGGGGGRGRGNHSGKDDSNDWKSRRDGDQKDGFRGRGGRGGRGRGRGGRGRGGRGGRDNRDRRDDRNESAPRSNNNVKAPMIQSTAGNGDGAPKGAEANGKRTRENDSGQAPPAKKVDTKSEATAAQ